jgi:excinuclease UvrABC nuclease subunit
MKQTLYRFYNQNDQLLYVGITKFFEPRLKQHYKNAEWFFETSRVTLEHYQTRQDVEQAESRAIKSEKPKYNIAKNPDKEQAISELARLQADRELQDATN